MSHVENADSSSSKIKRSYRKGNAMTASEKQLAAVARKRITHKELKVFVRNPLKDRLVDACQKEGLTQAEFIERLLESEFSEQGIEK
ncbi:replication regulatory protein RepA (plasmid) [Erwinia persicina]|uniref:replication regulatory protein RepA n=1 Tax=Erwinia persicina TaxID=55211 RepID=UPI0030D2D77D